MDQNTTQGMHYADLSQEQLTDLKRVENEVNQTQGKDKEIILLAYEKN